MTPDNIKQALTEMARAALANYDPNLTPAERSVEREIAGHYVRAVHPIVSSAATSGDCGEAYTQSLGKPTLRQVRFFLNGASRGVDPVRLVQILAAGPEHADTCPLCHQPRGAKP